jgi:hypothetical protein
MSFRKNIEPSDVLISSFQVNKTFTFTDTDSGSGFFAVPLIKGSDSNLYNFSATADSSTFSGSTYYHVPTYHEVNNLYYKDINTMRGYIDYIRGVPTSSNGVVNYTSNKVLDNTKLELKRPFTRQLKDTATLISVPQKFYGEYIQPGSVTVTDDSTDSTFVLKDDSRGNLYDVAYSSSYASRVPDSKYSGSLVGNVFYNDGVIVITETGSYSSVATNSGSNGFTLKFNSSQTIYEREYVCVVDENEFQHTTNKSLKVGRSGSFTMGSFITSSLRGTRHDKFPYNLVGYSTSSINVNGYKIGTELIGEATHSDFATYVTEIGLYNDNNELLAVGKLAKPIKNEKEMALTFVVRFDTN